MWYLQLPALATAAFRDMLLMFHLQFPSAQISGTTDSTVVQAAMATAQRSVVGAEAGMVEQQITFFFIHTLCLSLLFAVSEFWQPLCNFNSSTTTFISE